VNTCSSFVTLARPRKVCYPTDQLDIQVQHAAALLNSQYDYHIPQSMPSNCSHLDTTFDPDSSGPQSQSIFRSEFPLPPRSRLPIDLAPPQSTSNNRLFPPPLQGGPVHFDVPPIPSGQLSGASPRDQLIFPPLNITGLPTIGGEEPFSPSSPERTESSDSPNAAREVPPVIACRQW
jgi:hypothetical protein